VGPIRNGYGKREPSESGALHVEREPVWETLRSRNIRLEVTGGVGTRRMRGADAIARTGRLEGGGGECEPQE